ncbi:MAG TPA: imidazoleglycerol-phosphate dehydratase HisB [Elusimicrobiota bacterium]|nr:imidazoleglycerol-phosphate dehydratase HisB [Elusimicrobiota bacterium]
MRHRFGKKHRKTNETSITMELNLDGHGRYGIRTSLPFLDHMLELMAKHGNLDLTVQSRGDIHIDEHHLVEDIGIVMGELISDILGSKQGVRRYGQDILECRKVRLLTPMDESLSYVALDLSGRPFLHYDVSFRQENKSPFPFELLEDFFQAVAFNAKMGLHMHILHGRNNHHMAESLFKGFGRALNQAVSPDPTRGNSVPSTKGLL